MLDYLSPDRAPGTLYQVAVALNLYVLFILSVYIILYYIKPPLTHSLIILSDIMEFLAPVRLVHTLLCNGLFEFT